MQARITKWGNSCGIRIPRSVAKELDMVQGTTVDIHIKNNNLVISKAKAYKLDELLAKITPTNKHDEIDTGYPVGQEAW